MDIEKEFTNIQELLGRKILDFKILSYLSQKRLAKVCELGVRTVREIEKGESNTQLNTLLKLAIGLNIRMADLFDFKNKTRLRDYLWHQDYEELLSQEKKNLGNRILQLCKFRGISQDELSVLSRIASGDISNYIAGNENLVLFTLLKISIGLEVEIFDLFDYSGPMPDNAFVGEIQF